MKHLSIYLFLFVLLILSLDVYAVAVNLRPIDDPSSYVSIPDGNGGFIAYPGINDPCKVYDGTRNCKKYALIYVDVIDHRLRDGKLEYEYVIDIQTDAFPDAREWFTQPVDYFQEYSFEWDEDWWVTDAGVFPNINKPASWMIAPVKVAYCKMPDGSSVGDNRWAYDARNIFDTTYTNWRYPIGNKKIGSAMSTNFHASGTVQGIELKSSHQETVVFDCYLYVDPLIQQMIYSRGTPGSYTWNFLSKQIDDDLLLSVRYYLNQLNSQLAGSAYGGVSCLAPYQHYDPVCHLQWVYTFGYDDLISDAQNSTDPNNYPINTPSDGPGDTNRGNHTVTNTTSDYNPSDTDNRGIGDGSEGDATSGSQGGLQLSRLIEGELKGAELQSKLSFFTMFTNIVRLIFAIVLLFFYSFQIICVIYVFVIIIPDIFFRIQRFFVHMTRMKKR